MVNLNGAYEVAALFQPLAKFAQTSCYRLRTLRLEEPDHWHRLLRPRHTRPRRRRAADKRNELESFQLIEFHRLTSDR